MQKKRIQEIGYASFFSYLNSNLYGIKRLLTSADDLNNIRDIGIYWYTTGDVPANAPYPNASMVEVIGSGLSNGQIIQRGYRYGATGYSAFRAINDVYPDAQQWSYNTTNSDFPVKNNRKQNIVLDYWTGGNMSNRLAVSVDGAVVGYIHVADSV